MENSYDAGLTRISVAMSLLVIAVIFPGAAVHIFHSVTLGTIIGFTVSLSIFVWAFIYLTKVRDGETD